VDQFIALANAAGSAVIAALSTWAILSHRVRDGVLIKCGLILLAIGCAVSAWHLFDGIDGSDLLALNRARFVQLAGMLIVALGYWLHLRKGRTIRDLVKP
jgi:predicted neutral ceramidase superfamily lipid hydrolase